MRDELRELHRAAGAPTMNSLKAHADREGHSVSRATLATVLKGPHRPRWATAEAFIDACLSYARTRRVTVPADMTDLSRWRELYDAGSPPDRGTPARPAVRNTLPAGPRAFTGRAEQLRLITSLPGSGPAVAAVHGMAGVGKTALALHAAHQLTGRFPDRQFYLDLYAHTAGLAPVPPETALALLLAADGMDPRYVPDGPAERAALWRGRMADKRILLVLDNAAGSDQVTPLLPASAQSLVLITSRRYLGDLAPGFVSVPVDVPPPVEARQMFLRLAPRAAGAVTEVDELLAACGHLPLAISVLAAVFTKHRSWTVADLITETRARILDLTAEDRTVIAAFDLSLRHLSADRRRLFRLLGLHPGLDFDAYAAAALADVPLEVARRHLEALHDYHLIEEPSYQRFRLHDLTRAYARRHAPQEPAMERLLAYYEHAATLADHQITGRTGEDPAQSSSEMPDLSTHDLATTWMRRDSPNVIACIDHALTEGRYHRQVRMTSAIAGYLLDAGPWDDAAALLDAAVSSARNTDDRASESGALYHLANLRGQAGDLTAAQKAYAQALAGYQAVGDRAGQARVLAQLGAARSLTGHYAQSTAALRQALDISRAEGDRLGQARALSQLGNVHRLKGEFPSATGMLTQALALFREGTDRRGQAETLARLGNIRYLTGDAPGGIEILAEALSLYRLLGQRSRIAVLLGEISAARCIVGEYVAAEEPLREALTIVRELGARLAEAELLNELAIVHYVTGDFPAATRELTTALAGHRELGNRRGQAQALNQLGAVLSLTGDHKAANQALTEALDLYRALGNRLGESSTLTDLGAMQSQCGDHTTARTTLTEALSNFRDLGIPLGQANVLGQLGIVHHRLGDDTTAQRDLTEALAVCRAIGDRLGQAHVLNSLGKVLLNSASQTEALECHAEALQHAQYTSSPLEQARALEGHGRCVSDPDEAETYLRRAQKIYQQIGTTYG
jgi:tetratricopeptide (TPR) repeat protein